MRKILFLIVLLLLFLTTTYALTYTQDYNNGLTRSMADDIYCALNAPTCIFLGNITFAGDIHIIGDILNITVHNLIINSTSIVGLNETIIALRYWNRTGTTLTPANAGDDLDMGTGTLTIGDISFDSGLINIHNDGTDGRVQIGFSASAVSVDAIAFGSNAVATGINSLALGVGATTGDDNSIALGYAAYAPNANQIVIADGGGTQLEIYDGTANLSTNRILTTGDISQPSDTAKSIQGASGDKSILSNGTGMYFTTEVGDTPYFFDTDIEVIGTGTFGSTYQAVVGDDDSERAGYFTDGTREVSLATMTEAGVFTDGTYSASLATGTAGGDFYDGSNLVKLADGTYAINAAGNSLFTGDIQLGAGNTITWGSGNGQIEAGATSDVLTIRTATAGVNDLAVSFSVGLADYDDTNITTIGTITSDDVIRSNGDGTAPNYGGVFLGYREDSSIGDGNTLFSLRGGGSDGGVNENAGEIRIAGLAVWEVGDQPTQILYYLTPIGSTTPQLEYRFTPTYFDMGTNNLRTMGKIGVGVIPLKDLHLKSSAPTIFFQDSTAANTGMSIKVDTGIMSIDSRTDVAGVTATLQQIDRSTGNVDFKSGDLTTTGDLTAGTGNLFGDATDETALTLQNPATAGNEQLRIIDTDGSAGAYGSIRLGTRFLIINSDGGTGNDGVMVLQTESTDRIAIDENGDIDAHAGNIITTGNVNATDGNFAGSLIVIENATLGNGLAFIDGTTRNVGIGISTNLIDTFTVNGTMDLKHLSSFSDDHAFEIEVNANGFGDVKAIDINYITGAITTGQDEEAILVNIDDFESLGGTVIGLEVITTEGLANVYGMEVGALVNPILQLSGEFSNESSATVNGVDRLAEFLSTDLDINIFVSDDDNITIGSTTHFEEIEFIFNTTSSGSGISPVFKFSTAGDTWTEFNPTDGTNGMRNNGVVVWIDEDIPSWVTSGGEYLIQITRTKNSLSTNPIENQVRIVQDATEFIWDKNGDIFVNEIRGNALSGTYSNGEAYVCVYNNGTIFAKDSVCS